MPIYEYECPTCGRFDALQKMSAPALEVHDVCGSPVKKLISASAFAFKGSGFYINDYGGSNPGAITDKSSKGDKGGEKKAESSGKADSCAGCPHSKSAA